MKVQQPKGEGVPVRSLRVPSHVPSHWQTAAKVRGFSPIASGFTAETDWLLEGDGFELSVPRVMAGDSGRRVPAEIAVFEVAGTAVALQRCTKVVGPGCHPEFR